MSFADWRGVRFSLKLAVIVCLLGGCQSQAPKEEEPEARHLRRAASLCRDYWAVMGSWPAKLDDVKEWAVEEGKASADDFFSTRDNQPYGIVFFGMGNQLLVYEQTGENDKHFLFHMGHVSEVTKQKLDARIAYLNSAFVTKGYPTAKKKEKTK